MPQTPELRAYLENLLSADPYNKFCVDCQRNLSSMACVTYGTFVCQQCADIHRTAFGGRMRSQVKDVLNEHWDDWQLESVSREFGGNKSFFEFMADYNL